MLELREVRTLLALGEELHFGRAAARLGVSQSRVSETLRGVERRIGGRLFERTSRQVGLTALGAGLLERLRPVHEELAAAYAEAVALARGAGGTVRLGFTGAAGGAYAAGLIRAGREHAPDCELVLHEVACGDLLGPLRRGEVDALVVRLPIEEPDLTVGPLIGRESRLLAVALDHPLAGRASVSIEEAALETVFALANTAPAYWRDFHLPLSTPAGHALRRGPEVRTCQEILTLVAAGVGVAPLAESVARHYAQPDVAFVPVHDLPAAPVALIWRTAQETAAIRALARSAELLAQETRQA
ncbi:LysR substrate-binding domain-containing protein [Kitasatospora sp. NPDC101183]|uniref:LysR substrate-binding domain-containing protein n=1 Tax=Kitasatospora sp. NPDC101183 TaxID=3364100 RepID=UPI00382C893F